MLKDKLQISRERLEYYYSIFILIIIPVLIAGNTLLMIGAVRQNADVELRRKADLVNSVLSSIISQQLTDPITLQNTVQTVSKSRPELANIAVVKSDSSSNSNYKIIAAKDANKIGDDISNLQYSLVSSSKKPIAQLLETDNGRVWNVVNPILDSNNNVTGLVTLDVSLNKADNLISSLLLRSLVIMSVSVIVVVLLLINHFKFVEYAMLFRKLKEVDQLKNDFLSVATHELRAPMTVIKGNISNIMDGLYGNIDEQAKPALQDMYEESERLNNLVTDLLNVSRIEQGRIKYDIQNVNPQDIIQKIVDQFQPKATAKGLTLNFVSAEHSIMISVDPGRLNEIMINLIDNAIKYSRKGTVTITQRLTTTKVQISVKDTGIGMSAGDRSKLFNRFYRIQNEQTKDIGGTGLGLWIIKQYIESMNGQISVDSLEGVGSEFIIEFPITKSIG